MAIFEVPKAKDHGPYSAVIGTDWEQFGIRIEPPFHPGEQLLEYAGLEDDLVVSLVAIDETATLLSGYSNVDFEGDDKYKAAMLRTASNILERLGELGSKDQFISVWEKFKQEDTDGR